MRPGGENENSVIVGKGNLFCKGAYTARAFQQGEVVIRYRLRELSSDEYAKLSVMGKAFTHSHWGKWYLYSEPECYVNHSDSPNTFADLKRQCDIALRDIAAGEQITTNAADDDIG